MLPSGHRNRFFFFSFWTFFAFIVLVLRSPIALSCEYKQNKPNQSDAGIVIYSTTWCPYCTRARNFLDELQINYTNCDVEKSTVAEMRFKQLGGQSVPLILIGQARIDGFDANLIKEAIEKLSFDTDT